MVLLAVLPSLSHSATGTPIGVVCFSQTEEPCAGQGPIFTGTVGSIFRLSVFVAGSEGFGQFEVLVKTDPTVLKPLNADAIGSVLVSPEGVPVGGWQCINGGGANCGPQDGPGVVHFFGFGRYSTTAPTVGILFSIDYTVTGTANGSPIAFVTGCTNTSVVDGTCVTLGSSAVQVAVQTASFSNIAPTSGDFKIDASPSSLTTPRGMISTSEITLTSLGNFNGTLTTKVITSSLYLTGWLGLSVLTLQANTLTTNLTIFSLTMITPGPYGINITASAGSISHTATVQVTLLQAQAINEVQNGDFSGASYDWTTNTVSSRTVSGNCLNCFTTYPIFRFLDNPGPCPTAGKQGASAAEIQNTLGSSGYIEQSIAVPAAGADLALVSWGSDLEVSIVDQGFASSNGTLVDQGSIYYPGPFPASPTGGSGPCAGYTLMRAYGLSGFAGRTISLRLGAESYAYNVESPFFSDVQVVPIGNAAIRDFNLTVSPGSITVPRTQSGNVSITVQSLNKFPSTVDLNATTIPHLPSFFSPVSLGLVFSQNAVTLQPGQSSTITLTVTVPKGTPAQNYDLKITANTNRSRIYRDVTLGVPGVAIVLSMQNPLSAHPGDSVTIVNRFDNVGDLQIRITSVQISSSFGTFTLLNPSPCQGDQYSQICCYNLCDISGAPQLAPGGNVTIDLHFTIPSTAQTGNYTLVESVQWQYLTNFPKIWYDGGPNSIQSHIHLAGTGSNGSGSGPGSNSNTSYSPVLLLSALAGLIIPAIAVLVAGGLIAILAIILLRRRPNPTTFSSSS